MTKATVVTNITLMPTPEKGKALIACAGVRVVAIYRFIHTHVVLARIFRTEGAVITIPVLFTGPVIAPCREAIDLRG